MMKHAVTNLFTIIYHNTNWQTTLLNAKKFINLRYYTNVYEYFCLLIFFIVSFFYLKIK